MLALYFDGQPAFKELPRPAPGDGEVLVRVHLAGICRSDLEVLKGYHGFTGVMGHEFVGEVAGPGSPIELKAESGPGFVIGSRMSYWWENSALRFAPFFVHLRDGDAESADWALERATTVGPATIVLFDESGVSGNEWVSSVGGKLGFAVNRSDQGLVPVWVGDVATQCPM